MAGPHDARVVELWNDGYTGTTIAGMIGGGMTRSAVLGIIHRAKARGVKIETRRQVTRSKPDRKVKVARLKDPKPDEVKKHVWKPPALDPDPLPAEVIETPFNPGKGKNLLDSAPNACRFVIGHDGVLALFCEEPRRDEKTSFCKHHHGIVWESRSITRKSAPERRSDASYYGRTFTW